MLNFTRIASDAMDTLQIDAGILLTSFDPLNPYVTPTDEQILATTTGGINPTCVPQYSDMFADVDNAPNNTMEGKHLDGWISSMSFTSIKFNAENTRWSLGAADKALLSNGVVKIAPRKDVKQTDFKDLWWAGNKANGGAYVVRLINALSTGGLNIQSNKNNKGTNSVTVTGHASLYAQDEIPMEIYEIPPETAGSTFPVRLELTHATSTNTNTSVERGSAYTTTLAADTDYELAEGSVIVSMGGVDVTAFAYNDITGAVSIPKVTGAVYISAVATEGA